MEQQEKNHVQPEDKHLVEPPQEGTDSEEKTALSDIKNLTDSDIAKLLDKLKKEQTRREVGKAQAIAKIADLIREHGISKSEIAHIFKQ
ncbi:hypothetical protein P5U49_000159 [Neisseria gonorrhoeae]